MYLLYICMYIFSIFSRHFQLWNLQYFISLLFQQWFQFYVLLFFDFFVASDRWSLCNMFWIGKCCSELRVGEMFNQKLWIIKSCIFIKCFKIRIQKNKSQRSFEIWNSGVNPTSMIEKNQFSHGTEYFFANQSNLLICNLKHEKIK